MPDLDIPPTNRYKLLILLGGKCRICPEDNPAKIEIDHIYNDGDVERTKYGSGERLWGAYLQNKQLAFERLQPLCKSCHRMKTKGIRIPSLMDGIKAYETLSDIANQQWDNLDFGFNKEKLFEKLRRRITISEQDAVFLINLYFDDHRRFCFAPHPPFPVRPENIFIDVMRNLETKNALFVPKKEIINMLAKNGMIDIEAEKLIKKMLKDGYIFEPMPEEYKLV